MELGVDGSDMKEDEIVDAIRGFICRSFTVPFERPEDLPADLNLLREGVLDSQALVETSAYLETLAGVTLGDGDLTPENFHSVGAMAALVDRLRPPRS